MPRDYYTGRLSDIDRKANLLADVQLEDARRRVAAMKRSDSLDAEEARTKARRDAARCGEHQQRYDSAFQKFGKRASEPAADAHPPTYRRKLFSDGQNLLPDGHRLTKFAADSLDGSSIPELERQLLAAIEAEGENPSGSNVAETVDDPRAMRERTDSMGGKTITFEAKRSFIADLNRTGRKVTRIIDAPHGRVIWGAQFPHTPG
jgi:hypothetical protein